MASDDIQTNIRLPAKLKDKLVTAADANNRSLSAEVVRRLECSFEFDEGASSVDQAIGHVATLTLYEDLLKKQGTPASDPRMQFLGGAIARAKETMERALNDRDSRVRQMAQDMIRRNRRELAHGELGESDLGFNAKKRPPSKT